MFAALDVETNEQVISLDDHWRGEEADAELRRMARALRIVCPECREAIVFRYKEIDGEYLKLPHFSHKVKSECRFGNQSPEVMRGVALLYRRLVKEFPGAIQLHVDLHIEGWDRPADIYVRKNSKPGLAFWVLTGGTRDRWALMRFLRDPDRVAGCVVFTRQPEEGHIPYCIKLSTNLRDLIAWGKYDLPIGKGKAPNPNNRGHLHFLDIETGELTILRGLFATRCASVFKWELKLTGSIESAFVCPQSAELFFEDDVVAYDTYDKAAQIEERDTQKARQQRLEREEYKRWPVSGGSESPFVRGKHPVEAPAQSPPRGVPPERTYGKFQEPIICEVCNVGIVELSLLRPDAGRWICPHCLKLAR